MFHLAHFDLIVFIGSIFPLSLSSNKPCYRSPSRERQRGVPRRNIDTHCLPEPREKAQLKEKSSSRRDSSPDVARRKSSPRDNRRDSREPPAVWQASPLTKPVSKPVSREPTSRTNRRDVSSPRNIDLGRPVKEPSPITISSEEDRIHDHKRERSNTYGRDFHARRESPKQREPSRRGRDNQQERDRSARNNFDRQEERIANDRNYGRQDIAESSTYRRPTSFDRGNDPNSTYTQNATTTIFLQLMKIDNFTVLF